MRRDATATRPGNREHRWSSREFAERRETAPAVLGEPIDDRRLEELVAGYERITGTPVRSSRKRNLIAICARLQGDRFLALVADRFAETGTEDNLLGHLRQPMPAAGDGDAPPGDGRPPVRPAGGPDEGPADEPWGLTYAPGAQPPFDPTSKRRYDRRPSNPDFRIECIDFRAHQSAHRRTSSGWVCDACHRTPA